MTPRERGPETGQDEQPGLHELVKIGGRWAQVESGPVVSTVNYLDDGSTDRIVWEQYELARRLGTHVALLQESEHPFTDEELSRIRWGSEQEQHPHLKGEVAVFGEFRKRPE